MLSKRMPNPETGSPSKAAVRGQNSTAILPSGPFAETAWAAIMSAMPAGNPSGGAEPPVDAEKSAATSMAVRLTASRVTREKTFVMVMTISCDEPKSKTVPTGCKVGR